MPCFQGKPLVLWGFGPRPIATLSRWIMWWLAGAHKTAVSRGESRGNGLVCRGWCRAAILEEAMFFSRPKKQCPNCFRLVPHLVASKAHRVIHCGCYWDRSLGPTRFHWDEPRQPTGTGLIGQLGLTPGGWTLDSEETRVRKHWQWRDVPIDDKPKAEPMWDEEMDHGTRA